MKMRDVLFLSGTCAAVLGVSQAGHAQSVEAPRGASSVTDAVEDIVVTARRQSESLQTTPVAVTAVTGAGLAELQVTDVSDLQRVAPNLVIATGGAGVNTLTFPTIRGQSSLGGTASNDPAVGVYVDGVYVGRPGGSLLDLIDIRQVEVLRGPQGTLFGRNTTGGALSITSNEPADTLGGSLQLKGGNYDFYEATAVLNLPVSDGLAARVVYQHSQRSGYTHNAFLNTDVDDRNNEFVRASIKYTSPGGSVSLLVTGDYTNYQNNGQSTVLFDYNPNTTALGTFVRATGPDENATGSADDTLAPYRQTSDKFRTTYANENQYNKLESGGVSAILNVDLDAIKLKSISAYRALKSSGTSDPDGTPYRLLTTDSRNKQNQFQQEVQLLGEIGRFNWITGVFYFQENPDEVTESVNYLQTVANGFESRTRNASVAHNKSYAVYGQGYYQLTNRLRISAGARYTFDKRELILRNLSRLSPIPTICGIAVADRDAGEACQQTRSVNFDYISYLGGIDWQATDHAFFYAKTSRAFLAGGFNARAGDVPAFKPEQLSDVEIGAKLDWFDKRLRTNVAAFYGWQRNLQRTATVITPAGAPTTYIRNIDSAHVKGLEFEGIAVPWTGMQLNATLGLFDGKYDKFADQANTGTATAPVIISIDRSNERFLAAPKLTYSFGATQAFPTSFGKIEAHLDYAYVGKQTYYTTTPAQNATPLQQQIIARANEIALIRGYGLLNGQLSLELDNPNVTLAVWMKNITREKYYVRNWGEFYTSLGFPFSFVGAPRTIGATASYRF